MRNHKEQKTMCEAKKRRFYIPEVTAKAGLEALGVIKMFNGIGQERGVHPVTIGHWMKEFQERYKKSFYS